MDIKQALEIVVNGTHLSRTEMRDVMRQIMTGNASEAFISEHYGLNDMPNCTAYER